MITTTSFEIHPLDEACGAEVKGLDASKPVSAEAIDRLKQGLAEHGVLVFRDQALDIEAAQVAFCEAFGETVVPWLHGGPANTFTQREEVSPRPAYTGAHPSCVYWVNGPGYWDNPDDGYAQDWHADVSYLQVPLSYSFLYALQAPEDGYQTWYANQYALFDHLDVDMQTALHGLSIGHFFKAAFPNLSGALHPVLLKHPRTGRTAVYGLPGYDEGSPVGLTDVDWEPLYEQIKAPVLAGRFVYKHTWRTGDLVVWDNRCVLHRRGPQVQGQTRILRRTVAQDGSHEDLRKHLLGF